MTALLTSVIFLLLFAAGIAGLPYIYAAWRRVGARQADLQIWRVMARRGIVPAGDPVTQTKVARAVRRCVMCPSIEQCDGWLAGNRAAELEDFCPNATLLDQLQAKPRD